MPTEQEIAQLEQTLQKLIGETCDAIKYYAPEQLPRDSPAYYRPFYYGEDNDYYALISLQFGANRTGTRESMYALGMLGLWKIAEDGDTIGKYIGALDTDGLILENINRFKNHSVRQITLDTTHLSLVIEFDNNLTLEIPPSKGLGFGFVVSSSQILGPLHGGSDLLRVVNGEIYSSIMIS